VARRIYNGNSKTEPFEGFRGKIVTYPLEASVAAWARRDLEDGRTLSRLILERTDFSQGSWSALLPGDTPSEVANERIDSGVLPEPPVDTWESAQEAGIPPEVAVWSSRGLGCSPEELVVVPKPSLILFLAQGVRYFLGRGPDRLCLVEDPTGSPQDPYLSDVALAPWAFDGEVYFAIRDRRYGMERIADIIDDSSSAARQTIILTSAPNAMVRRLASSERLSEDDLAVLVDGARHVILQAYDGESYLAWERKQPT
jgi:hypothetical protein